MSLVLSLCVVYGVSSSVAIVAPARSVARSARIAKRKERNSVNLFVAKERRKYLKALEKQMEEYADCLAFEQAAAVRDEIAAIKEQYGD